MPAVRTFFWSRFVVLGLLASTAALAVVGVCAAYLDLPADAGDAVRRICVIAFAAVAGFALTVAQSAAALLPTLKGKPDRAAGFWIAVFCAVLCGLVSLVGVWLGHGVLTGHVKQIAEGLIIAGGLGLTFVKPAMSYVIAECEAVDKEDAKADGAAEDARLERAAERAANHRHQEALARISGEAQVGHQASEPRAQPAPVRRPATRPKLVETSAKTAAGAVLGLTLLSAGEPAHATPGAAPLEPVRTQAEPRGEVTAAKRAEARSLIAQGIGPAEVHRRTGVPHGTCKRMGWEFRQGRWAA